MKPDRMNATGRMAALGLAVPGGGAYGLRGRAYRT
jgi:hypothetical protein